MYRGVKVDENDNLYIYDVPNIANEQKNVQSFSMEIDTQKNSKEKYTIEISKLKKGDIFEIKSFVSTSFDPFISNRFTNSFHCCLFRIELSSETKGIFLAGLPSPYSKEMELLLNPSKFKITNISNIHKKGHNQFFSKMLIDMTWIGEIN